MLILSVYMLLSIFLSRSRLFQIFFIIPDWRIEKCFIFAPGEMAEWSNAAVLKTVVPKGTGGSNPSLSAFARRSNDLSLRRRAVKLKL